MPLLNAIISISLVNFIGYFPRGTRLVTDSLVQARNQLVYPILLPVLIIGEISRSLFQESFIVI
jgi:predicted permease